jgi:hypothetical protein
MTAATSLNEAIRALKAGSKAEARQLLEQVLRQDRTNETAWLWLSGAVETDEERIECLEQVLIINPGHKVAKRGLQRLRPAGEAVRSSAEPPSAQDGAEVVAVRTPGTGVGSTGAGSTVMDVDWRGQLVVKKKPETRTRPTPSTDGRPTSSIGARRTSSAPAEDEEWQSLPPKDEKPRVRLSAVDGPAASGGPSTVDTALKVVAGLLVVAVVAIFGYLVLSLAADSLPDASESDAEEAEAAGLKWQEFASRTGGFYIVMPGSPDSEVHDVFTAVGVLELHTFFVQVRDSAYMVGYSDYPKFLVDSAVVDEMLDGARDGAVANVDGRLVWERRIRLQGYPGRELWIEADVDGESGLAHARLYLVGTRLYQILVAGPTHEYSQSNAEKFLNSFLVVR